MFGNVMDSYWAETKYFWDNQLPLSMVICQDVTLLICISCCWSKNRTVHVGYNATTRSCIGFNETMTASTSPLMYTKVWTSKCSH